MALNSFYVQLTNLTTGPIYLGDLNQGLDPVAYRTRRPGPVYLPALSTIELALDSSVLLSYESGDIRQQHDVGHLRASMIGGAVQVLTWQYDFALDGGLVSAITLRDIQRTAKTISYGTMTRGWIEVLTPVTSGGGATLALGYTGFVATGFLPATVLAGFTAGAIIPFAGTRVHNGTAAVNPLATRVTTAVSVITTVAVAPLTAGKFNVHLEVIPTLN
jgi:hypothetical protein